MRREDDGFKKLVVFFLAMITAILFFIALNGCSANQQRAQADILDPQTGKTVARIDLVVSKWNLLYWSKFQADTNTFGMTTQVYNAEGGPDAEGIEAVGTAGGNLIGEAIKTALEKKL